MTAIAVQQRDPDKICPETVYPGIQCPSLTPLVLSWLHMVSYGLVWPPLAPFDPIWPSTAPFDHILPGLACLTLLDTIWPGFAPFDPVLPHLTRFCPLRQDSSVPRGGKRGGAWKHCSQMEVERTILGRRIWAKFTALVAIFINRAIYRTYFVEPMKNRFFS